VIIRTSAIRRGMGFSTSLQGQASHEALLARQDAEIKLLETMRRCLTTKIKSDREYASTISSLATQGKKIERNEDLVGSLIAQVINLSSIAKSDLNIDNFIKCLLSKFCWQNTR